MLETGKYRRSHLSQNNQYNSLSSPNNFVLKCPTEGVSLVSGWSDKGIFFKYLAWIVAFAHLLVCTSQAYEPSRLKKEPGVGDRDINGLMDRRLLHVWSKVLEWHPTVYIGWWGRTWWQSWLLRLRWNGRGRTDVRVAHQLPGKLAEKHVGHCPLDKNNHYLGLGKVCRKVSLMSGV